MADSTTIIDTITTSEEGIEGRVNENFDASSPAMAFGRHGSVCVGLSFGIYGGKMLVAGARTTISNQLFTLTASATNYIRLNADGSFSVVTSAPTGWPDVLAAGAVPLYTVIMGTDAYTSYVDHRVGVAIVQSFVPSTHVYTYAASVAVETNLYDVAEITLTGNITLTFSGGIDGRSTLVRLRQDATGSRILTLGTGVRLGTDITAVTLSTAASKLDYFVVRYDGTAAKYDVLAVCRGF